MLSITSQDEKIKIDTLGTQNLKWLDTLPRNVAMLEEVVGGWWGELCARSLRAAESWCFIADVSLPFM